MGEVIPGSLCDLKKTPFLRCALQNKKGLSLFLLGVVVYHGVWTIGFSECYSILGFKHEGRAGMFILGVCIVLNELCWVLTMRLFVRVFSKKNLE